VLGSQLGGFCGATSFGLGVLADGEGWCSRWWKANTSGAIPRLVTMSKGLATVGATHACAG